MASKTLALKNFKRELVNCLVDLISQYSRQGDLLVDTFGEQLFFAIGELLEGLSLTVDSEVIFLPASRVLELLDEEATTKYMALAESEDALGFVNEKGDIKIPVALIKAFCPTAWDRLVRASQNFLNVFHQYY